MLSEQTNQKENKLHLFKPLRVITARIDVNLFHTAANSQNKFLVQL